MAQEITIKAFDTNFVSRAENKLDDLKPLLRRVGVVLLRESQQSFEKQKFGGQRWKGRYPGQSEPFINVAGAVSDLAKGPNVRKHRFNRRPALRDTGALKRSLSPAMALKFKGPSTVQVGTTLPYASKHQMGGVSSQQITSTILKNLTAWLKKIRKSKAKGAAHKAAAGQKLGFLYNTKVLKTKVNARPFVGVTDTAERDIVRLTEEFFFGGGR